MIRKRLYTWHSKWPSSPCHGVTSDQQHIIVPQVPQVPQVTHSTTTLGIPVEIQEAHRDGATPDSVGGISRWESHRKKNHGNFGEKKKQLKPPVFVSWFSFHCLWKKKNGVHFRFIHVHTSFGAASIPTGYRWLNPYFFFGSMPTSAAEIPFSFGAIPHSFLIHQYTSGCWTTWSLVCSNRPNSKIGTTLLVWANELRYFLKKTQDIY